MEEQDYRTTYDLEGHNWWFVGMRRISLSLLEAGDGVDGDGERRGGTRTAIGASTREAAAGQRRPRILDVGCGTGIMLEHLGAYGEAVGLDISPTALQFCRARGERRLVRAGGERLPFASASFDAVTAFGVVEHIDADKEAVAEWARVLRPGGQLVLLTSAYQWLWSGHDVSNHHVRRYLTGEVADLLRAAGLEPAKVSYINTFLFPPILVVRILERARRRGRPPDPKKDTGEVPRLLNRALTAVLDVERRLVERGRLPFGVSIVARATKPAADGRRG